MHALATFPFEAFAMLLFYAVISAAWKIACVLLTIYAFRHRISRWVHEE